MSDSLNPTREAEIRQQLAAATTGPYVSHRSGIQHLNNVSYIIEEADRPLESYIAETNGDREKDAVFLADSWQAETDLLAGLGRLRLELSLAEDELRTARDDRNASQMVRAQLAEARGEVEQLRAAIRDSGYAIMQTSAGWSIHDVTERAKVEEQKTAEVIGQNIDLELKVVRLRELALKALGDWNENERLWINDIHEQSDRERERRLRIHKAEYARRRKEVLDA